MFLYNKYRGDTVRLLDQKAYQDMFKKDTIQAGLFYSAIVGIVIFVLFVGTGFGTALISGVVVFGLLFGTVYGIRMMIYKGVERKKRKKEFDAPHIEVKFRNEPGMLLFYNDVIRFIILNPGSDEKDFEMPISENLFIASGEIEYTKFQSYRKKGITEGFVLVREMPTGVPYQFVFYNVDGSLERVNELVSSITRFEE